MYLFPAAIGICFNLETETEKDKIHEEGEYWIWLRSSCVPWIPGYTWRFKYLPKGTQSLKTKVHMTNITKSSLFYADCCKLVIVFSSYNKRFWYHFDHFSLHYSPKRGAVHYVMPTSKFSPSIWLFSIILLFLLTVNMEVTFNFKIKYQSSPFLFIDVFFYYTDSQRESLYIVFTPAFFKSWLFLCSFCLSFFLCRLPFWQRHIVLPVSQKTCHHQKFVF